VPDPAPPSPAQLAPETGLARGRWEAPAWAFWVVAAAAVVGGLAWLLISLRMRATRSSRGTR
jgi:hypothetical protein